MDGTQSNKTERYESRALEFYDMLHALFRVHGRLLFRQRAHRSGSNALSPPRELLTAAISEREPSKVS